MGKKKPHAPHINHERWMVSFADFMTLLFALFVVLFAISQVDAKKLEQVAQSLEQAFGLMPGSSSILPNVPPKEMNIIPNKIPPAKVMEELRIKLQKAADDADLQESINITKEARGLVLSLRDAAFFDSGSAQLRSSVLKKLEKFLRQLESVPNDLRIEGHTDSVPIRNSVYPSNWELSGARAGSLLRFMISHTSVPQRKLAIAGYADQRPIADNSKEAGRQRNRRVDIVILTDNAVRQEPTVQDFSERPASPASPSPTEVPAEEAAPVDPGAPMDFSEHDAPPVTGTQPEPPGTEQGRNFQVPPGGGH